MKRVPEAPCYNCGVRADVGCRHRAAIGTIPSAIEDASPKEDGRARANRNRVDSPWGKAGNPTEREFAAMAIDFRKRIT